MRVRTTIFLLLLPGGHSLCRGPGCCVRRVGGAEIATWRKNEAWRRAGSNWCRTFWQQLDEPWSTVAERIGRRIAQPRWRGARRCDCRKQESRLGEREELGRQHATLAWASECGCRLGLPPRWRRSFTVTANTRFQSEIWRNRPAPVMRWRYRKAVRSRISRRPFLLSDCHGINAGNRSVRLVEVRGVPVRPNWDLDKQAPAEGLFLAGRIWDDERLRSVLQTKTDKAQFFLPGNAVASPKTSEMSYMLPPLRDWLGRDVALLLFTNEQDPQTGDAIDSRGDRVFRTCC